MGGAKDEITCQINGLREQFGPPKSSHNLLNGAQF